jgi:5-methylcytosine-specific restriction endonuclease McrA
VPGEPYYKSPEWRALRLACLKRDHFKCVVPGCGLKATSVDHIIGRREGGADALTNLRSLCKAHDNMVMQSSNGERRRSGQLTAKGCDADGWPRSIGKP